MIYLALFRDHQRDPLGTLIKALTRGSYVHAALLIDPENLFAWEEYWPRARTRKLRLNEIDGIDFFEIAGISGVAEKEQLVRKYCLDAVADREQYSIIGLFRFLPLFRWLFGENKVDGLGHPAFCSQACFEAIDAAGVELLRDHSWDVSPQAISTSPFLRQVTPELGWDANGQILCVHWPVAA